MKNTLCPIILITLMLATACEEEIPWKTEPLPAMLVVEGGITNEYKKHQVILSTTEDYFYDQQTPRVSNAKVTISDGDQVFELAESTYGSGIYETLDSVRGEADKTYTLDVELETPISGVSQFYASEKMIPGINIDSMDALIYENPVYFPEAGFDSLMVILMIYGGDPPDYDNYYQFNLYKNNILLQDTIDEISISPDSEGFDGSFVNTLFFFQQFEENEKVELEIISVSEAFREFVIGVQNIANMSSDPFNMSGPPANAIGNIQGGPAIGFFKVAYVSRGETLAKLPPME